VPPPRKTPERPAPKMDQYKPIIDGWLEEDQRWPRKQRHTARRVWQRLVSEHQADVGESTVRRYVRTVRERQSFPLVEVTVPQHHPLGSKGEVDFGEAKIVLAGIPTEVSLFVMRLSSSGKGFCHGYLNETQDVFLDGHVRAFDHFGGVPGTVSYDNRRFASEGGVLSGGVIRGAEQGLCDSQRCSTRSSTVRAWFRWWWGVNVLVSELWLSERLRSPR